MIVDIVSSSWHVELGDLLETSAQRLAFSMRRAPNSQRKNKMRQLNSATCAATEKLISNCSAESAALLMSL